MKLTTFILTLAAAAALGLAVGFAWRGKRALTPHQAETTPPIDPSVPRPKHLLAASRPRTHVVDDASLAARLERDLSMSTGVTRWLYWLEALEKAGPADFVHLARLAHRDSATLQLVATRWIELFPRHLFDTLCQAAKYDPAFPIDTLANTLFREWPRRDPDAVIAALNESIDLGRRDSWRNSVASRLIERDAERGLRLMSEWHIENFGPRMTAVQPWAAADPFHAAEFALAHPAGYVSQLVLEVIGKEWAKTQPAQAMSYALKAPGKLGHTLAAAALKSWTETDLSGAAEWLASADTSARNRLSPPFVEAWAQTDPAAALAWSESHLTGRSLAQAVGGVLTGAAQTDIAAAAQLVVGMEPSPARGEAALAVARKWLPTFGSGKTVAPETIAWLASLDADTVKAALDQTYWQWSENDPTSMAAFLKTGAGELVSPHVYGSLVRGMARKNPMGAMEWANNLPANRRLSAGGVAFTEWQRSQPESAMQWLKDLPPADSRRQPFFEAAIQSLAFEHEPNAMAQLAALSAPDRAAARTVLETMRIPEDRRAKLLEAVGMP